MIILAVIVGAGLVYLALAHAMEQQLARTLREARQQWELDMRADWDEQTTPTPKRARDGSGRW